MQIAKMSSLLLALRIAAISNLLLLAALFIRHFHREHWTRYVLAYAITLLAFLVLPLLERAEAPFFLVATCFFLLTSLPFAFWMLANSFFTDLFVPKIGHWVYYTVGVAATFFAFWPNRHDLLHFIPASETEKLRLLGPGFIYISMIVLGIARAIPHLKTDLADKSEKLPVYLVLKTGLVMFFIINGRIIFATPNMLLYHELFSTAIIFIGTFILALYILRFEDYFRYYNNSDAGFKIDEELLQQLTRLFEEEKIYRTPGLTVRHIAGELSVPEYKIRKLINMGLHYRNFNDYVNRFRISEACSILQDHSEVSITRMALELGYKSVAPFNKAFKELKGVTPSEYRQKKKRAAAAAAG